MASFRAKKSSRRDVAGTFSFLCFIHTVPRIVPHILGNSVNIRKKERSTLRSKKYHWKTMNGGRVRQEKQKQEGLFPLRCKLLASLES
jgi:hypothetical protein